MVHRAGPSVCREFPRIEVRLRYALPQAGMSSWRRACQKGAAKPDAEGGVQPNQPRVPRGNPDGGQWTSEGTTDSRVLSDATPDPIVPWAQYAAADGHHYVPRGVFENEKYSFSSETLQAFEDVKTGPLNDPTSNWYDEPHRNYNKAVEEALDRFLARKQYTRRRDDAGPGAFVRRGDQDVARSENPPVQYAALDAGNHVLASPRTSRQE